MCLNNSYLSQPCRGGLSLGRLPCLKAILVHPDGRQSLLLSDGRRDVQFVCEGESLLDNDVAVSFIIDGILSLKEKAITLLRLDALLKRGRLPAHLYPPPPREKSLREALIAVDAWINERKSQKETAVILFGEERVRKDWRGGDSYMRHKVRRLIRKGLKLVDGDHLKLLRD